MEIDKIYQGDSLDVLKTFEDNSVDCCVTSPPYYALRDYGVDGQIGLEETPEKYIERLTEVFMEVHRVLKPNGTLWLNIGDSYNGNKVGNTEVVKNKKVSESNDFHKKLWSGAKPKDLIGIPWMLAFSLRNAGWYLRQDIIWHKPNPMPESVTDRCTKSHEYIFLLSKGQKYYFDYEAIQEAATGYDGRKDTIMKGSKKYDAQIMPNQSVQSMAKNRHERWKFNKRIANTMGKDQNSMHLNRETGLVDEVYPVRNKRDVWTINPKPNKEAHFATYPPELVSNCIIAGCPEKGIVLDPFMGSGTTGIVANKLNRHYVGIELNPEYVEMAERRIGLEKSQLKLF